MAKLVAVFNLVAGAASIGGLWVSIQLGNANGSIVAIFAVALLLSIYVLLVPANQLQWNPCQARAFPRARHG